MKLVLFLLITFSLNQEAQHPCSEGCLACGTNNRCLLCDFKSGYAFKGDHCTNLQISNCESISFDGQCLVCSKDYFLDQLQNKCNKVPQDNLQQQCVVYQNSQNCQVCEGAFLINGKCVTDETVKKIDNCQQYSGPQICEKCNEGYLPNYQKNKCVQTKKLNNCSLYSNIKCNTCNTGYVSDKNYISNYLRMQLKSFGEIQNFVMTQETKPTFDRMTHPFTVDKLEFQNSCLQNSVLNCKTFENFDQCLACEDGYFLKDNFCYSQPKEIISNCRVYDSQTKCNSCNQGYYRKSDNECKVVTTIENCHFYNTQASSVICSQCFRNFYLDDQLNQCLQRKNLNNRCKTYNINKDNCTECLNDDTSYYLTDDKLACLIATPHCKNYSSSNKDTQQLNCIQCEDLYFLNSDKQCILGTVPFCRVYIVDQNKCQECQNGYFVFSDGIGNEFCKKHQEVDGCETYNNQTIDECKNCQQGYMMMTQKTNCVQQNIDGCAVYTAINQCGSCKDGYNFVSNSWCEKLDIDSHCLRAELGVCKQCEKSHTLINTKCIGPFEYQTQKCLTTQNQGDFNNYVLGKCQVCQKQSVPFNMKNNILCLGDSEIISYYQQTFIVSKCEIYQYNTTTSKLVCQECQQGHFLVTTGTTQECKDSCQATENEMTGYFTYNVTSGLVYTRQKQCRARANPQDSFITFLGQQYQSYTTYSPVSYHTDHLLKNDYSTPSDYILVAKEGIKFGQPVSEFIYKFPKITTIYAKADLTKEIKNCEMYSEINQHQNACTKCKFGYFGLIQDWQAEFCHEYDTTKCLKCTQGYYPDTSKNSLFCIPQTLTGCERFKNTVDECLMCKDKLWLDTTSKICAKHTHRDYCYSYHKFKDVCLVCKELYHLNDAQTKCELKISNCIKYDKSTDPIKCLLCEPNYILNISGNKCDLNLRENCYFTPKGDDSDTTNTCLLFNNTLKVKQTNRCLMASSVLNCAYYSDKDTCTECEHGFYLLDLDATPANNLCCAYTRKPNGTTDNKASGCTTTNTDNCYEYQRNGAAFECKTCIENYHLTTGNLCCAKGEFNDNGTCEKILTYDKTNTRKCQIYDIFEEKCTACTFDTNQYYLSKGFCCQETQYWKDSANACTSIATDFTAITQCDQFDDDEAKFCKKCKAGHSGKKCCPDATQYPDAAGECQNNLAYCDAYENGVCKTCKTGFYKINSETVCCVENKTSPEYSNSGTCTAVPAGEIVADCLQYDENKKCTKCDTGKYITKENVCCANNSIYNGTECIVRATQLANCAEIDRTSFKTYSGVNTWWDYLCSECNANHALNKKTAICTNYSGTPIAGCKTHYYNTTGATGTLKCQECQDNKILENTELTCCDYGNYFDTTCKEFITNAKNCYLYDFNTKKCAAITTSEDFLLTLNSKSGCARNNQGNHILGTTTGECCFNKSGVSCETANTGNCSISDGTNCLQCDKGFNDPLTANTCIDVTKANDPYTTDCQRCKKGFVQQQADTTCCATTSASNPGGYTANCSYILTAGPACSVCYYGFYLRAAGTKCCEYGTYENASNACVDNSNSLCAEADNTGVCQKCYFDNEKCNSDVDFTIQLIDLEDSVFTMNFNPKKYLAKATAAAIKLKDNLLFYYGQTYKNTNNQCCLKGEYYNTTENKCLPINIDNCVEMNASGTSPVCNKCDIGYSLTTGNCIKITDCSTANGNHFVNTPTYYNSNGHCCPKRTYYDVDMKKCTSIIDPYCEEAQNYGECQTCTTGYTNASNTRVTLPIVQIKFYAMTQRDCKGFNRTFHYKACIPNGIMSDTNVYSYDKFIAKMEYCGQIDFANKKCLKCVSDAYLADETNGLCCRNDQILFRSKCIEQTTFPHLQNCLYNDVATQMCKTCEDGYNLQDGICCKNGSYLNPTTYQCSIKFDNCKNYDNYNQNCNECNYGYYFSEKLCCLQGTYYDSNTQTCKEHLNIPLYYCKESYNNKCTKCYDETFEYNEDGIMIKLSYMKLAGECVPYGTVQSSRLNTLNNTLTNNTSFTEHYGIIQHHPELDLKTVEFCAVYDNTFACTQCDEGYSLQEATGKKCCPMGTILKTINSIEKCVEIKRSGKYNCTGINPANSQCSGCQQGFYLTNNSCCKEGEFYNDTYKRCQETYNIKLQNCISKSDNDSYCKKCASGFYLSFDEITNERYCCKAGEYWDFTLNMCQKISQSTNGTVEGYKDDCERVYYNSKTSGYHCGKCKEALKVVINNVCTSDSSYAPSCYVKITTPTNYCKYCKDVSHYRSSPDSNRCCAFNNFFNGTACVTVNGPHNNFNKVYLNDDNTFLRGECKTGYFLEGSACLSNTGTADANKCIQLNGGSSDCLFAEYGYKLQTSPNTTAVEINTVVKDQLDYTQCSADVNLQCKGCNTGYQLSHNLCCKDNYYYDQGSEGCVEIKNIPYCLQYNGTTCTKCDLSQDYYLSSGYCCKRGYVKDGTDNVCNPISKLTDAVVNTCYFMSNNTTCISLKNTKEGQAYLEDYKDCTGTKYLQNSKCCDEGNYFDTGATCSAIDTKFNCLQLKTDDSTVCVKCKDNVHYFSNDKCCPYQKYWNGTDCVTIATDSDCQEMTKVQGINVCQRCTNKNVDSDYPSCCEGKFLRSGQAACEAMPTNCSKVKNDGTCLQCSQDYYLSAGSNCCKYGEYHNGTACVQIALSEQCQQKTTLCESCQFDEGKQMVSYSGKCCKKGEIFLNSHPLGECFDENLFYNCMQYNYATNKCTKCKTNYNLTQDLCCPSGKFLAKVNTKWQCIENTIENCKEQSEAKKCSECNSGYYTIPQNTWTVCCKIGWRLVDNKCTKDKMIDNCIQYNASDQCTKCNTNYFLRTDKDSKSKCCSNKTDILITVKGEIKCMNFNDILSNCEQVNYETFACDGCSSTYSKQTEDPICCLLGKHYDFQKEQCIDNYIPFCDVQKENECKTCKAGTYAGAKYLTQGGCCSYGYYFDKTNYECKKHAMNDCKEYIDNTLLCKTCESPKYLTYNRCCPEFHYWNNINQKCERRIDHCKIYEDNTDNSIVKCKTCELGFILNKEQTHCCSDFSFYDSNIKRCIENKLLQNVYEHCIDWDKTNLFCKKCHDGYYVSLDSSQAHYHYSKCCPLGKQVNKTSKNCTDIDNTAKPNCNQIAATPDGSCSGCKDGYKLKTSNKTCVQILPNCVTFNAENNTCSKCDKTYYVTQGKCCQWQFYFDVTCVQTTQINGCKEYNATDNTQCAVCLNGFYKVGNKCVTKGKFLNGTTEEDGNVKNCEQYGANNNTCSQCFPHHTLQMIATKKTDFDLVETVTKAVFDGYFTTNTVSYCYPTYIQDCTNQSFAVNTTNNEISCTTCEQNYFLDTTSLPADKWVKNNTFDKNCKYLLMAMTFNKSTYQCTVCNTGFYLNRTDDICVARDATFNNNCERLDPYSNNCLLCDFEYHLDTNNKCVKTSLPNCLMARADTTKCLICNKETSYTYVNSLTYPDYECEVKTNWTNEDNIADPPTWAKGKVTYCDEHHQCKDEFLSNLNLNIQKYLSCHVCKESNRIPFISLDINNTGVVQSIKEFSMWQPNTQILSKYIKGKENKTSECFKNDLSEFALQSGQTNSLFPSNCAVGIFNSSQKIDVTQSKYVSSMGAFDYTKANPICGECKPGYKATRYTYMNMAVECTQIQNCKSGQNGKSFSSCDECDDGYYFKYDTTQDLNGGVDRTECYKSTDYHDPNCFAFDTTNNQCHTCKIGYSKNHDKKCEKLNVENCQGEGNFHQVFTDKEYNLSYYRSKRGCTQCATGYQKFLQNSDDVVCLASTYAVPNSNTKYIKDCEFYENFVGTVPYVKCYKCKSGTIMTEDNACTSIQAAHTNCKLAKNNTKCAQCAQGYVLVDDKCQTENLQNCKIFKQGTSLNQQCQTCKEDYMKTSNGTCILGTVQHCSLYNDNQVCQICKDQYYLTQLQNEVQYCMPLNKYENRCDFKENSFHNADFRAGVITCETCSSDTFLETISDKKVCVKFNLIENCINYDRGQDFSQSTLKCTQCREDHYLNTDNVCILRKNIVDRCQKYFLNKDECESCDDQYILTIDKKSCYLQPSGIVSCAIYKDSQNCIKCNPGFYLLNNACSSVNPEKIINQCLEYNQNQLCISCAVGHLLQNNQCVATNVANCSEFININSCKVCSDTYGLKKEGDNFTCIKMPEIFGCVKQSQDDPYPCLVCNNETYPQGSPTQCTAVPEDKKITNCAQFNDQLFCTRCSVGYYVSSDKRTCHQVYERSFCADLEETDVNECVLCETGYDFDENLECKPRSFGQLNGCYVTDTNNSQKCQMCQFGFSMNDNFICTPNEKDKGKENPITPGNNDNGNGNGNGKNIEVLKAMMRMFMILFFVINQ